jgi:hypothetical protein
VQTALRPACEAPVLCELVRSAYVFGPVRPLPRRFCWGLCNAARGPAVLSSLRAAGHIILQHKQHGVARGRCSGVALGHPLPSSGHCFALFFLLIAGTWATLSHGQEEGWGSPALRKRGNAGMGCVDGAWELRSSWGTATAPPYAPPHAASKAQPAGQAPAGWETAWHEDEHVGKLCGMMLSTG